MEIEQLVRATEPRALGGRRIVVTGATRGIGRTIAVELARRGALVVGVGRDEARGRTLGADPDGQGRITFVRADLSEPGDASQVIERSAEVLGGVDALVNNAAAHGRLRPLLKVPLDEWQAVLATNLTAPFLLSRTVAPLMARTGGVIVNLLAIQARLPIRGYGAYAASKGGLEALTRHLAVELADLRIRVVGLAVGAVYSDSVRAVLPEAATSADLESVPGPLDGGAPTLVGRMGRPSDIARIVAFLVSDEASFLTGSIIVADGGRTLSRAQDPLVPRMDE